MTHDPNGLRDEALARFGDTDAAQEWFAGQVRRAAVEGEQWAQDMLAERYDAVADHLATEFTQQQAAEGKQWAVRLLTGDGTADDERVQRMLFGAAFERIIGRS